VTIADVKIGHNYRKVGWNLTKGIASVDSSQYPGSTCSLADFIYREDISYGKGDVTDDINLMRVVLLS
jgi:hypothetical protein